MKITFVLPFASLNGGIRVVAIYADALAARGHEVQVVSTPRKLYGRKNRLIAAARRTLGLAPSKYPSYFDDLAVPHRVINAAPVRDIDVPDADIVVATWWETAEWVNALSANKGIKVHFVQGHEVFPSQPIERVRAAYRLPLKKITIAQWLVDVLRDDYGIVNVPLIPNAVDHKQFHAPARGRQTRPTVGFLYAPGTVKGCDVLLRAVGRLRERFPNLAVRTFGTREPLPELPLPEGAEFILRPPQDSIREIYSSLDLWLCGSRSEGFHLMPLEALACGTPVVSTRIGGAVETVREGVNGYLVPIEDWEALAERAERVLRLSDAAWREMSANARAVAGEFSWERSVERMEDALERIRREHGAAAGATR